jgi:L-alanine-DL-glutamate epimerase-like enolase superfamily enzyme
MTSQTAATAPENLAPALDAIEAFVFRSPIETPVRTSFGVMRDRPAVFVRITDVTGRAGWGEVWCNFPSCGAEHRARLIQTVFAPWLEGRQVDDPRTVFAELTAKSEIMAIQAGEAGPIAGAIAGIDIALWDLAARRAGQPLWRYLGGASPQIRVYGSGLNPDDPGRIAKAHLALGYRAFKLKVGFGEARDLGNLTDLRAMLPSGGELMVDANQAWDLETALHMAERMAQFNLRWLEEPLRADRPWSEWQQLAKRSAIPLAAGENLAGEAQFEAALAARALATVQPDMAKWGGFSGVFPVAGKIRAAGACFCPHYLAGGIGLLASAHLLAGVGGGEGALEVDVNPNPLRALTCGPLAAVNDGQAVLSSAPGLGVEPDLSQLREFAVTF